jgi:putative PIN family toxin of toxin-antitoxin system
VKIVLDTHVLVSGLLRPHGPAGDIVRMASSGSLTLSLDARILSEYRRVLARPRFSFNGERVELLLHQIASAGDMVACRPLPASLPDANEDVFLEITMSGEARRLVTENPKRYPPRVRHGLVVSPQELLELYRKEM